jgi:hypothetical protein
VFDILFDILDILVVFVVLDNSYLIGVSWLILILLLFWFNNDYEEVSYLTGTKFNWLL